MSANNISNDSDDLEDLDYGDDDFESETKTEHSQNSALRASTQDVDDDEEDGEDEEQNDDDDDDNEEEEHDATSDDHHNVLLGDDNDHRNETQGNSLNREKKGQKRKRESDEQDCDESRNSDKRNVERCKYWPQCLAGDECSFYHPTKPCRTFPNCRFGSNCLYIHPPCKFAPYCTKFECPFAHPAKQTPTPRGRLMTGSIRPPIPLASPFRPQAMQANVPKCKFGFKCANLMCKFSHQASEPCRYGSNCLLENCAFAHPEDQQKKSSNVFKWTSKS